jgi:predicted nucleic acid-binding protein
VPFVLDASVAASWHFEDERSADADAALHALNGDTAIVPIQWWFEIRNVALHGERRGRATPEQTLGFFVKLTELPIELGAMPDDTMVIAAARKHGLTFYDAAYLELAQREKIALATLDDELAAAARAEGIPIVAAA